MHQRISKAINKVPIKPKKNTLLKTYITQRNPKPNKINILFAIVSKFISIYLYPLLSY